MVATLSEARRTRMSTMGLINATSTRSINRRIAYQWTLIPLPGISVRSWKCSNNFRVTSTEKWRWFAYKSVNTDIQERRKTKRKERSTLEVFDSFSIKAKNLSDSAIGNPAKSSHTPELVSARYLKYITAGLALPIQRER